METPKTLDEQLTAALADAKAANDLATDAQAQLTAKDAELATAKAGIETANQATAKAEGERDTFKAELETAKATATAETEKAAKAAAELDKLKAAVASNPAMADAAAGRPAVKTSNAPARTKAELHAEYSRIMAEDPKAATAFYRANREAIESR